jgi:hypothetical protein
VEKALAHLVENTGLMSLVFSTLINKKIFLAIFTRFCYNLSEIKAGQVLRGFKNEKRPKL